MAANGGKPSHFTLISTVLVHGTSHADLLQAEQMVATVVEHVQPISDL